MEKRTHATDGYRLQRAALATRRSCTMRHLDYRALNVNLRLGRIFLVTGMEVTWEGVIQVWELNLCKPFPILFDDKKGLSAYLPTCIVYYRPLTACLIDRSA